MNINGFLGDRLYFLFCDGLIKALPYGIILIFTTILTPTEYSIIAEFLLYSSFIVLLIGFNSNSFFLYFDQKVSVTEIIAVGFSYIIINFFFVSLVIAFIARTGMIEVDFFFISLVLLYSLFQSFVNFMNAFMIRNRKSESYFKANFLGVVVSFITSVSLISQLKGEARIYGIVIMAIVICVTYSRITKEFSNPRFNSKPWLMPQFYKVGLKLAPHTFFSGWARLNLCSLSVFYFLDEEAFGAYTGIMNLSMLVNIALTLVVNSFQKDLAELVDFSRLLNRYIILALPITFLLAVFIVFFLSNIANNGFSGYLILPFIICTGFLLNSLAVFHNNMLLVMGKSGLVSLASTLSTVGQFVGLTIVYALEKITVESVSFVLLASYLLSFILSSALLKGCFRGASEKRLSDL